MVKRKTKKIESRKKIIKEQKKKKITKNTKFSEVLSKYPQSAQIMMDYGLHCIGCQVAAFETIQQGAKAHGMSTKDLNKMIDELNKVASEKKIEYKHKPIPKERTLTIKKPKKKSFWKKLFR